MQLNQSNRINLFFSLFLIFLIYPTIRGLFFGSEHATGFLNIILAALPELVYFFLLLWGFRKYLYGARLRFEKIDWLVAGYIFLAVFFSIFQTHHLRAFLAGFRITYLPMGMFFLLSLVKFEKSFILKTIHRMMQLFTAVAVIGYVIYFIFPEIQSYFHFSLSDLAQPKYFIIRMTSIVYTPVVFGVLMLVTLLYWSYRYFLEGKWIDLLLTGIVFGTVVLSVSRGPILAAALGELVLIAILREWKRAFYLVLLLWVILIAVSLYATHSLELIVWIFKSSGQTVAMEEGVTRVNLWKETMTNIHKDVSGLGIGNAGHVAHQMFPENVTSVSRTSTDGWYFKLIIESGLQQFALYVILFGSFFIAFIRAIKQNKTAISTFIFSVFIVTAFINIVSNALDFAIFSYLYWFLLGVFINFRKTDSSYA